MCSFRHWYTVVNKTMRFLPSGTSCHCPQEPISSPRKMVTATLVVGRAGYLEGRVVAERAEGDRRVPGWRSHGGTSSLPFWPHLGRGSGKGGERH